MPQLFFLVALHKLKIGKTNMLTDLKACYSPQDLIFIVSLFIMTMVSIGAFVVLMTHAIRGAINEVKDIKDRRNPE